MSLKITSSPKAPEEWVQTMNVDHCLLIVLAIGKYTDSFWRGYFLAGGVTWQDLSMEEFCEGEGIFQGGGAGFPGTI